MAENALLTIIVPNYKTPELTKLCLRSIRKYTDCSKVKVVAVDNDSQDASVEYLRSLKWITLIERKTTGESGPAMHAKALDMVMQTVDTPLVLVIHTDTIVISDQWLDFLLGKIYADEKIAGVGSWKLEKISPVKIFFKKIETGIRRMLGRQILDREHYFRSHCAMYKSDCVRETNGFHDNESAGVTMFRILREKGYKLPFIESEELCRYLRHLNHATMILNPTSESRKSANPKKRMKLEKELKKLNADKILADDSLDK